MPLVAVTSSARAAESDGTMTQSAAAAARLVCSPSWSVVQSAFSERMKLRMMAPSKFLLLECLKNMTEADQEMAAMFQGSE